MLVKKDVLKLEETDKKKFNDAKPGDKARVLVNVVGQKRHEAGQVLVQTFLNTNKNAISTEGKIIRIYNISQIIWNLFISNAPPVSSVMPHP